MEQNLYIYTTFQELRQILKGLEKASEEVVTPEKMLKITRKKNKFPKLTIQINAFRISIVFGDLNTIQKLSHWIIRRKNTSSLKLYIN